MKTKNQSIVTKKTVEEARKLVLTNAQIEGKLSSDLLTIANDLFPQMHSGSKPDPEAVKKLEETVGRAFISLEVETHAGLMEGFGKRYWGMADELSSQIIKEYGCNNHAEKMLAEAVVGSFMRFLDSSRRFNGCADAGEHITQNRTNYLSMMSKQMDRAHRQYLSSLMALKQLKAPPIEMNIKARHAFVAQNQQFNTSNT